MRTTLSIDDDVALQIEEIRKSRDTSLKAVVNEALRGGLEKMIKPAPARPVFRIRPLDLGKCNYPNLDNIAEVLADAEGEWYK